MPDENRARSNLTSARVPAYPVCDGSPIGDQKGTQCGRFSPNAAAAPATVSGELSVKYPLGYRVPGRRQKAETREPGDLPSAVVTRERCRSGSTDGGRTKDLCRMCGDT